MAFGVGVGVKAEHEGTVAGTGESVRCRWVSRVPEEGEERRADPRARGLHGDPQLQEERVLKFICVHCRSESCPVPVGATAQCKGRQQTSKLNDMLYLN